MSEPISHTVNNVMILLMNQILAWMEDNQADGNVAMEHFLKNYESSWTTWVSDEVATKVKTAVAKL